VVLVVFPIYSTLSFTDPGHRIRSFSAPFPAAKVEHYETRMPLFVPTSRLINTLNGNT